MGWLMSRYLVQFMPLCMNGKGKKAIRKYNYMPFIDHSIRREPSFENPYPGVSSLCRGRLFAPRLDVGDEIVYITKPGKYDPLDVDHYRLTAILKVIVKCKSHYDAANWYVNNGLSIPTNCIVEGNPALHYDKSAISEDEAIWAEGIYNDRANNNPDYLICVPVRIELENPPIILKSQLFYLTGFSPGGLKSLRNPKKDNITENHLELLINMFHY